MNFIKFLKEFKANIGKIQLIQEQATAIQEQVTATQEQVTAIREQATAIQEQVTLLQKRNLVSDAKLEQMLAKQTANDILCTKVYSLANRNFNSIFSYCINAAQIQQSRIRILNTEVYNYYKRLHELTKVYRINNSYVKKIRIGRNNDGGYVMISPFSNNTIAYSLGISDDVSWDKDMVSYGYNIYQYDHTIDQLPEENESFHWEKIGLTGQDETDELKHLDTLISKNGHEYQTGMVLKMDIEGFEWDLLCNCKENTLKQFDQILIELHNLNDLILAKKILEGLKNLTRDHYVVHIHGNFYGYTAFCGDLITPDVIEVTLIKKDLFEFSDDNIEYLSLIDEVNQRGQQDVWLSQW